MPAILKEKNFPKLRKNIKLIRNDFGFTLIELLIVIAVVGILAGIVMVAIDPASKMGQARDSQRKQDVALLAKALEEYYVFNQVYPIYHTNWEWNCDSSRGANNSGDCVSPPNNSSWDSESDLNDLVTGGYLRRLPVDPVNGEKGGVQYFYRYEPDTNSGQCGSSWPTNPLKACNFFVAAILEKPQDDAKRIYRCNSKAVCKEVANWYDP